MLAKEWEGFWWRFAVGVLLLLPILISGPTPYEQLVQIAETEAVYMELEEPSLFEQDTGIPENPVAFAMEEMALFFGAVGKTFFILIAVVLGVGLLSAEAGRNTIFFLLSKPVSRTRVLLAKYAVGAAALLGVAVFFGVGLVFSAGARGYPVGSLDVTGVALSIALLWLGSLSIFGLALALSVVLRDLIQSAIAVLSLLVLVWVCSNFLYGFWMNYFLDEHEALGLSADIVQRAIFPYYWSSAELYLGDSFASTHFVTCFITAVVPLLAAMWLFNRKAY
jgi:ABC-type transport system involved in multi-copper enzyme maturation permease subunit